MLDDLGVDYVEGGYPGANPTDTEFFADRSEARERDLHRLRHDPPSRPLGLERSGHRRAAGGQGERDLLRGEVVGVSGQGGAGDDQRGEPRLDPRQRRGGEGEGPRGAGRLRALLRRLQGQCRTTRWPAPRRPTRPARAGWCCATPMAARCRTRSSASSARSIKHVPGATCRHPCAQRHRAGGGEFAGRGARRRAADPGHAERHRRALRQRQSLLDHPDAEAEGRVLGEVRHRHHGRQAVVAGACVARAGRHAEPRAGPACALCRAKARSRPRPASMPRRSPRIRRPTSTWRRRRSAIIARCWFPTRPGRSNLLSELDRMQIPYEQERSEARAAAGRGEGARGDRLCLRVGRRIVRTAGAAHARPRAGVFQRRAVRRERRAALQRARPAGDRRAGGGEGECRRRDADFGGRRQRSGQCARRRAAQGSRQVSEIHRGAEADRLPRAYPQWRHRGRDARV